MLGLLLIAGPLDSWRIRPEMALPKFQKWGKVFLVERNSLGEIRKILSSLAHDLYPLGEKDEKKELDELKEIVNNHAGPVNL